MGGGGQGGLESPPLWKQGGLSPLILQHAYIIVRHCLGGFYGI